MVLRTPQDNLEADTDLGISVDELFPDSDGKFNFAAPQEIQGIGSQATVDTSEETEVDPTNSTGIRNQQVVTDSVQPIEPSQVRDQEISSQAVQPIDPPEVIDQEISVDPVEPISGQDSQPDIGDAINNINRDEAVFEVHKYKRGEVESKFYFSLLPAIKTDNISQVGFNMNDTPGAAEGLSMLDKVRYNNKVIPGGHPIVDAIGLESSTVQLVGAFTGWDEISRDGSSGSADEIKVADLSSQNLPENHSYSTARVFSNEIVKRAGEVLVRVKDNKLFIKFHAVIIDFQIFTVRHDLTYYKLNCLMTRYEEENGSS
jgi:hypothetical protein